LRRENLKATYLDPVAPIRLNLVTHGTFGASKYNHAGHSLSEKALSIYERKDLRKLEKGDVWVFAGRAPRGISPQRLKRWILKLESRGVRCVVDTSGPFLASALTAKPSFLKVNLHEMGEALGRRFLSLDAFWEILPSLQKMGLYYGAVTDGSNGAVVWEGAEVVEAHPPRLKETQSCVVGAGDAFLAGYLKAWREKWTLRDRVCWAVAAGATVAECGIGGFDPKKVARKVRQVSLE
jgi:1-phosphofructokinase